MFFHKKYLKQFDPFFSSRGYRKASLKVITGKNFWESAIEFRMFVKGDILCLITDNKIENFVYVKFFLIKNFGNNTFDFYYVIENGMTFLSKNISLIDYSEISKSGTEKKDLLAYHKDKEIPLLIDTQITFLEENLVDIEEYLKGL